MLSCASEWRGWTARYSALRRRSSNRSLRPAPSTQPPALEPSRPPRHAYDFVSQLSLTFMKGASASQAIRGPHDCAWGSVVDILIVLALLQLLFVAAIWSSAG